MNESIKVGKPNRWLHRNLGIVNTIIKSYGAWAHFNNEAFNLQFQFDWSNCLTVLQEGKKDQVHWDSS